MSTCFNDRCPHCGSNVESEFEELEYLVLEWADAKGIIQELPEQALVQVGKMEEEVLELRHALQALQINIVENASYDIVDNNFVQTELELGDVLVTVIVTAACAGIDPVDALAKAYHKIKNRKGKTVDGIFIKDAQ